MKLILFLFFLHFSSSLPSSSPPSSFLPQFSYDPYKGFLPSHPFSSSTPPITSSQSAIEQIYLKSGYDIQTIGKILENIRKVVPEELYKKSETTFLKTTPSLSSPSSSASILPSPLQPSSSPSSTSSSIPSPFDTPSSFLSPSSSTFKREFLSKTTPSAESKKYFAMGKRRGEVEGLEEEEENESEEGQGRKMEEGSLYEVEKIPIYVPIPLIETVDIPSYEHYEYDQNIREIKAVKVEIPVEHRTIKPKIVKIAKEEVIGIPQAVPIGVKIK